MTRKGVCLKGHHMEGLSWCPTCREEQLKKIENMTWEEFWEMVCSPNNNSKED